MKYFNRLFYYIFKNGSRYGGNEFINAFFATFGLFAIEFINIASLDIILEFLFKVCIDVSYETYEMILIAIFLLNVLYFMPNKRYCKIKESFVDETDSVAKKNNFWCKMYIIVSFVSFLILIIGFTIISKMLN